MKKNLFLVFILTELLRNYPKCLTPMHESLKKLNSEGVIVKVLDKVGKISWEI